MLKEKIKEYFLKLKKKNANLKYKRLYDSHRNYEEYPFLDILIIYLEEVGIASYEENFATSKIVFKDNTELFFWDANKYYAWMSSGVINFSNGKSVKWSEKMPSYEVLYKYKRAVLDFGAQTNYNEFLPIKIQRKLKLEKLK